MSFYINSSINILNNLSMKQGTLLYRAPAWNNLLILVIKVNQNICNIRSVFSNKLPQVTILNLEYAANVHKSNNSLWYAIYMYPLIMFLNCPIMSTKRPWTLSNWVRYYEKHIWHSYFYRLLLIWALHYNYSAEFLYWKNKHLTNINLF